MKHGRYRCCVRADRPVRHRLSGGQCHHSSYFSDAVYEQVKQDLILAGYNENMAETLLTSGGLRVESTLDPKIQAILNEEYADPSNYPENVKWYLNYALTIISPDGTKNNFSKET